MRTIKGSVHENKLKILSIHESKFSLNISYVSEEKGWSIIYVLNLNLAAQTKLRICVLTAFKKLVNILQLLIDC